jgi:hypothetical protein
VQKSSSAQHAENDGDVMERIALLVGVDQYNFPGFTPLKAPLEDIEQLGDILKENGDFKIYPSLNEDYSTVRQRVLDLVESRVPEDTILFYYSGHGLRDFGGELYLTTHRSNPERPRRDSITATELQGWLSDCRAQKQIIILDCCFSGAFSNEQRATLTRGEPLASAANFTSNTGYGSFVLMASDRGELVPTGDDPSSVPGKVSHYTDLLIKGLQGAAAPDDDSISVPQLADYLEREGPSELGIHPKSRRTAHGSPWLVRNPSSGLHRIPENIKAALTDSLDLTRIGAVWQLGSFIRDVADQSRSRAAVSLLTRRREAERDLYVREAIDSALQRNGEAVSRLDALQRSNEAIDNEKQNLEQRLAALGKELVETKTRESQALSQSAEATRNAERLLDENKTLRSDKETVTHKLSEALAYRPSTVVRAWWLTVTVCILIGGVVGAGLDHSYFIPTSDQIISALKKQLSDAKTTVDGLTDQISKNASRADTAEAKVKDQESKITNLTNRAQQAEQTEKGQDVQIGILTKRAEQAEKTAKDQEAKAAALNPRLELAERTVKDQEVQLNNQTQRALAAEQTVKELQGKLSSLISPKANEARPVAPNTLPGGNQGVIWPGGVVLRDQPGEGSIVGYLESGSKIEVIERVQGLYGWEWLHVRSSNYLYGGKLNNGPIEAYIRSDLVAGKSLKPQAGVRCARARNDAAFGGNTPIYKTNAIEKITELYDADGKPVINEDLIIQRLEPGKLFQVNQSIRASNGWEWHRVVGSPAGVVRADQFYVGTATNKGGDWICATS